MTDAEFLKRLDELINDCARYKDALERIVAEGFNHNDPWRIHNYAKNALQFRGGGK